MEDHRRRCPACNLELTVAPLCEDCEDRARLALNEAAELYTRAHMLLSPAVGAAGERVSGGSAGSTSPVSDMLLGQADVLARVLGGWEALTLNALGLSQRSPAVRWGHLVQRAAHTIASHLDAAVRHPGGVAYAVRLLRVSVSLRQILGICRRVEALRDPCPECDTRGLTREDGTGTVACQMCAAVWTPQEYLHLAIAALGSGATNE